jgi:hypothetical protein
MFDDDKIQTRLYATPSFTAERTTEGARILLRGRRLEQKHYAGELYPTVVTIEHHYERRRPDGLPTLEQHSRHHEILVRFIDEIEKTRIGIHVLADTTQGLIREWFYVNDVPRVDQLRAKHLQGHGEYELCYEEDSTWSFLDGAISRIRGTGWGWAARWMNLSRKIFGGKLGRNTRSLAESPSRARVDFPDDENGNVLRQMAVHGADLHSPRIIDFEHRFPDAESAQAFHRAVADTILEAAVRAPDRDDATGWQVQCRARMIPTHAAITETELRLAAVARKFGGFPDGWGSLSNPDGSPAQ